MITLVERLLARGTLAFVAVVAVLPTAAAHHSPEEVISQLTQTMRSEGITANLLVRRADEWRVLGELGKSAADYQLALKNDPANRLASHGLAEIRLRQHRFDDAIEVAKVAINLKIDRDSASPFHAFSARAYDGKQNYHLALAAWKEAIACDKPEVDWLLQHARTLQRLERHEEARDALATAKTRNSSVVLHRVWIESLIRCEDFKVAEEQIETGLANSKWQSYWLLQRAQLRLAKNERQLARADAIAAYREIARRTVAGVENPILEDQRRLALRLINQIDTATNHSVSSNI